MTKVGLYGEVFQIFTRGHPSYREVVRGDFVYGSVLGLPRAYEDAAMVGFETGSFRLYVEKGKEHGAVFDFLVLDVEAAKRQTLKAGCTIVEEDPAVPRCYIRDPCGLVFNLSRGTEITFAG